jgi:tetratricopeptide (TPR) repeat protein
MQPTNPSATDCAEASVSASPIPGAAAPADGWWLMLKLTLIGLALGALTWVAYANSFTAGLTLDNSVIIGADPRLAIWDPATHQWNNDALRMIFTQNWWWPTYESDLYRPLTTLSYAANYSLLGEGTTHLAGYHIVNFLIHWANAWLVMVILRRLTGRLGLAALAAALFAVHPVNTEAVTNIVGRADLLATFSILFGGWCYMRAGDAGGRVAKIAWLGGLGLTALWGIFAKESAVLICGFVLLYDVIWRWPKLPGETFRARLGRAAVEFGLKGYVALLPAVLTLLWVRYSLMANSPIFGQIYVDNPLVGATSWFQAKMTAIAVLGRYFGKLIWPRTLSADYSYHQIPLFGEPGYEGATWLAWASLAVIVVLLWTAFRVRRTQPLYAWGVGFFFGMILITSNLPFLLGSIMAERFLYLPSIGFCAVAALALCGLGAALARLARIPPRWQSGLAGLLLMPVLLALTARAHARNADWQDNLSLWTSILKASPQSFKAWKGYGGAVWGENNTEQNLNTAIAYAEISRSIIEHPPIPLNLQDETLYLDLGSYYGAKGQFLEQRGQNDAARQFLQKAVDTLACAVRVDQHVNEASRESSLAKGRLAADIPDVGNHKIYVQLGETYELMHDWPNAEKAGRYTQHLEPNEATGYHIVGDVCLNTGRVNEAVIQYMEAMILDRDDSFAWKNLAICYQQLGLRPQPVLQRPDGFGLDIQSFPLVRQQLNQAAVTLVRNFEDAKQSGMANTYRNTLIKNMGVPPELFNSR